MILAKVIYKFFLVACFGLSIAGVLNFAIPSVASANFNSLPNRLPSFDDDPYQTQFINISTAQDGGNGGGGGGSPLAYVKLYNKTEATMNLTLGIAQRKDITRSKACDGYRVYWNAYKISSEGVMAGTPSRFGHVSLSRGCTIVPGTNDAHYPIQINDPSFMEPQTEISQNGPVYSLMLELEIRRLNSADENKSAALRLYSSDTKMGYPQGQFTTILPAQQTENNPLSEDHVIAMKFRSQCGAAQSEDAIIWSDADFNTSQQDNGLTVDLGETNRVGQTTIIESARNNFNERAFPYPLRNGFDIGGFGNLAIKGGHKYALAFDHVNAANGIVFNMPYDSANYYFDCPPDPDPPPPATSDPSCTSVRVRSHINYLVPAGKPAAGQTRPTQARVTVTGTDQDGVFNGNDPYGRVSHGYTESGRQSKDFAYNPIQDKIRVKIDRYYDVPNRDAHELAYTEADETIDCFSATCEVVGVTGAALPDDNLVAGQSYGLYVKLTNTSPAGVSLPRYIFKNGANRELGVTINGNHYPAGGALAPAPSGSTLIPITGLTAPDKIDSYVDALYPDYYGHSPLAPNDDSDYRCRKALKTYQEFSLTAFAKSDLTPTAENPNAIVGQSYVINSKDGSATMDTTSRFWKVGTSPDYVNYPTPRRQTTHAGAENRSAVNKYIINENRPLSEPVVAGEEYCTEIWLQLTDGYQGPGGINDKINPSRDERRGYSKECDWVNNKPYFKAYNGSISAAGAFKNSCHGGILAGWNNTERDDKKGYAGSGTELGALARDPITGVSSAFLNGKGPTWLTFANTVPSEINTHSTSPALGGNFGKDYCSAELIAAPINGSIDTQNIGSYDASGGDSIEYSHKSRTTVSSSGDVTGNRVLIAYGDVYITENIKYTTGPWLLNEVPSLKIHATGNIYIDPGVIVLDGVYVAQSTDTIGTGTIFTCGKISTEPNLDAAIGDPATITTYKPVEKAKLYERCNNQLTVNGSFIAENIKLMRTYGSLRDSVNDGIGPPGTPADPITEPGEQSGLVFWAPEILSGAVPPSTSTHNCTYITLHQPYNHSEHSSDGYFSTDSWANRSWSGDGARICAPKSKNITLRWVANAGNETAAQASSGQPHCTNWFIPFNPDPWNFLAASSEIPEFKNSWLCSNLQLEFSQDFISTKHCIPVRNGSDTHGNRLFTGGPLASFGAFNSAFLCEPIAGPRVVNPPPAASPTLACSNKGQTSTTYTCAAEVFKLSPEVYLSKPPDGDGAEKGVRRYDSMSSLPPVL